MPEVADRPMTLTELAGFHPRQREAMRAVFAHTYTLYGGAAGGGKSYWLRWMLVLLLIRWARRGIRGVRVGLFSADYPSLHDRQLSKIRKEFPDWLGTFNESTREFRLCESLGGGVVCFRNLDDAKKYKSAEFGAIAVEELTESELAVFNDLRWRLRWPGINDVKFLGATNPGGIGHHWVKGYWIERQFPSELNPAQFVYVRALSSENPHNDPSYQAMLDSLPEDMRAALRDGSWDYFVGQVFSEFRRDMHTCKPFGVPQWWRRWIGHDPGYTDPGVWLWFAADQDSNVYVYRELTLGNGTMGGADGKTPTATPSEQGREVKRRAVMRVLDSKGKVVEEPEKIDTIVCGMDAWYAKDKHVAKTDVDYYRTAGLDSFQRPIHGPGSRAQRAKTLHEYLRTYPGKDGKPTVRLRIFETCKKLIETLPSLVADPNDVEAVADSPVDHWYDALTYGLSDFHANRSQEPRVPLFKPGTAGDILNHAELLAPKPKTEIHDPFAVR